MNDLSGTIVVTGGAGFIGSNFVYYLLKNTAVKIVVVDKLTYAGNTISLEQALADARVVFVQADICDGPRMERVFREHSPVGIINFAAESHVDRSIDHPDEFIKTNIVGTHVLLTVSYHYLRNQGKHQQDAFRFLHVSTDEVYGSLGEIGLFRESSPYNPNSPYAASKASADHLVQAYYETYKLPTIITNCSNNYGPYQFPEKLIPLMILNALDGRELPVYGDGSNVRDWLYVDDHCSGILLAFEKGVCGEKYNIGGNNERRNIDIVTTICDTIEQFRPAGKNQALAAKGIKSYTELIRFVEDRPGHDKRYAIDASKIARELDWKAVHTFETGIVATVRWYLDHQDWCRAVQSGTYNRERLGTGKTEHHTTDEAGAR